MGNAFGNRGTFWLNYQVTEKDLPHMVPTNLKQQLSIEKDCSGLSVSEPQNINYWLMKHSTVSSIHFSITNSS